MPVTAERDARQVRLVHGIDRKSRRCVRRQAPRVGGWIEIEVIAARLRIIGDVVVPDEGLAAEMGSDGGEMLRRVSVRDDFLARPEAIDARIEKTAEILEIGLGRSPELAGEPCIVGVIRGADHEALGAAPAGDLGDHPRLQLGNPRHIAAHIVEEDGEGVGARLVEVEHFGAQALARGGVVAQVDLCFDVYMLGSLILEPVPVFGPPAPCQANVGRNFSPSLNFQAPITFFFSFQSCFVHQLHTSTQPIPGCTHSTISSSCPRHRAVCSPTIFGCALSWNCCGWALYCFCLEDASLIGS